jgi:hypothetical protein
MRINKGFLAGNSNKKFEEVFKKNLFHGSDSLSGAGSDLTQTQEIVKLLPGLLQKYQIQTFLDVPCGDFNWMRHVPLQKVSYLGADIVGNLIVKLQNQYATAGRKFIKLNMVVESPPKVDAIFCRDLMVHLNTRDIRKTLENIKKSGSLYLLTTTFLDQRKYKDLPLISRGIAWRPINFQLPPWNFPEPEVILLEKCTEGQGAFSDKAIALWRITDLP